MVINFTLNKQLENCHVFITSLLEIVFFIFF